MSMHLVFVRARAALGVAAFSLVFAACGGGNGQMPPAVQGQGAPQAASAIQAAPATVGATSSVRVSAAAGTYKLPLANGFSGTISLSAENAPPNATLRIHAVYPAVQTGLVRSSKTMSF